MANYAYIRLKHWGRLDKKLLPREARIAAFTILLRETVEATLGRRWSVTLAPFEHDGPTWLVTIPFTAKFSREEAGEALLAPGEDVGFPVSLQDTQIAFRHGPNMFERWAQGCIEEALADYFNAGVYYDSTDETVRHGTREYRRGSNFKGYLARNFDKPLTASDEAYFETYRRLAPPGHWDT